MNPDDPPTIKTARVYRLADNGDLLFVGTFTFTGWTSRETMRDWLIARHMEAGRYVGLDTSFTGALDIFDVATVVQATGINDQVNLAIGAAWEQELIQNGEVAVEQLKDSNVVGLPVPPPTPA